MAARKQLWHPDDVRRKIQASQLINRLEEHVKSDTPLMDSSQVQAAKLLLDKSLPSLSNVVLAGDQNNPLNHKLAIEVAFSGGESK